MGAREAPVFLLGDYVWEVAPRAYQKMRQLGRICTVRCDG